MRITSTDYIQQPSTFDNSPRRALLLTLFIVVFAGLGTLLALRSHATTGCDLNATTGNFAAQVSAASPGQTICLASGNYGNWTGTNKAIAIVAASGASPQMTFNFGSGDSGFTLDGMTGMGGQITAGASNITIKNSTFTLAGCGGIGCLDIEGSMSNIVIDHNNFTYAVTSQNGGSNSKIFLATTGSTPGSAATVENNDIENGDLDGIHIGGGSGMLVLNNTIKNLCDLNVNHTDNIQFEGAAQTDIKGNYVYESQNCATQGITSFDGGTSGVIIENNVVDVPRDWGIEFYSDQNSIIRHNTVVYHPKSYSEFNTGTGQIDVDRKTQDPAGVGTHVYDNIATDVGFSAGSTGTADHNISGQTAVFAGGASPTTHDGFLLAAGSPGKGAASDGTDIGIYAAGSGGGGGGTPAASVSLSASPTSVVSGSASTLSWSSANATSCTASGGWSGSKATSGSASTGALSATTSYSLSCTGAGGSASSSASVTVTNPAPGSPTVHFSASPTSVTSGSASTLSWSSTNATSCTASGGWSGSKATSGSASTGALSATTSFSLSCTGAGGSASSSASVTVTKASGGSTPTPVVIGSTPTGTPPPTVSGKVILSTGVTNAKKVTYSVDGKTVASPTIDTTKLTDGTHTITAKITEKNGRVVTKKQTIKVNNHHALFKNVMVKYGPATTIGTTVLSLLVVAATTWYFVLRPRPQLLHEMLEHTNFLHQQNQAADLPDGIVHSGSSVRPQALPTHVPAPGSQVVPSQNKDNS